MTQQDIWPKGRLVVLSESDCWKLLGAHSVGRVAWSSGGRPHIVPLNFAVLDGQLWVRTTPYSELARECLHAPVAFEVDEIDDFTHSGVSVVVHGIAQPARVADLPAGLTDLESWADGTRSLVMSIEVDRIDGRRLLPS